VTKYNIINGAIILAHGYPLIARGEFNFHDPIHKWMALRCICSHTGLVSVGLHPRSF